MASAKVGSPMLWCHLASGSWLVTRVERAPQKCDQEPDDRSQHLDAALVDGLLALADFIQHIEPVHDLVHIGIIGQLADGLQGFLFGGLYGVPPESTSGVNGLVVE